MKGRNIFLTVFVIVLIVGAFFIGRLTADSYDEMQAQITEQQEIIDAYQRQIEAMQGLLQDVQDAISNLNLDFLDEQTQAND